MISDPPVYLQSIPIFSLNGPQLQIYLTTADRNITNVSRTETNDSMKTTTFYINS